MKTASIAAAAFALFGGASAQNFRVLAQTYWGTPGDFWGPYDTYYGDGNMYVGPGNVPADLTDVFNFTIPDFQSTQPDIRIAAVAPGTLPGNTFLALNNGTGAREPLVFSNDESVLGEDHINKWLRYGTFLLPQAPDLDTSTVTHFYLEPTEEEETFRVTWRSPGTPDEDLQRVNLTAIL